MVMHPCNVSKYRGDNDTESHNGGDVQTNLVQIWWFRPSVESSESAEKVFKWSKLTRNERIGLSTFKRGAVYCQRITNDKVVNTSTGSMRRQIWAPGYEIQV